MATNIETRTSNFPFISIQTKSPPTRIHDRLQTGTARTLTVNPKDLEDELRSHVKGEVRFSDGDRALYASDAGNYRMIPIGVVIPKDADDVAATVAACRGHGAPIVARGGGTGIPGQSVNVAVMIDFSKYMKRIVELNAEQKYARVQSGVVLDELRDAAKKYDLTFGPDPATHSRCTLGGMIGNNSCGIHSVMAGRTSDNIEELDIILYDGTRMTVGATSEEELEKIIREGGRKGEIYARLKALRDRHADAIRKQFPKIPRRVSGFNLPDLLPENNFNVARALVGSECTCVLVLEAKTKLVYNPPVRSLLVIGYKDIFEAADNVVEPMKFNPVALEALDDTFIDDMKKKGMHPEHLELMPEGHAWLLVEFGGRDKEESDANARKLMDALKRKGDAPPMKLFDQEWQEKLVWHLREEGLGATAKVPNEPENHEGWEDAAVPPEKLGAYLREFKKLMDKYHYKGALYGHFGQGCVHTRLNFDLETAEGIAVWRNFLGEAADLVHKYNGSLSGEHGDGQARGELLPRMFDADIIEAFREFKSIWDPDWMMNPGKVIDPFPVDQNLRLGANFRLPQPETHFKFPTDKFSFAVASERCVGAGVCRRHHTEAGGVMCPSYMVTREEKHSTRGRARLLNEMMRGEAVKEGWQSEAVKEALDLCLACKGCRHDCPVQVDMATYKAEFLSHYYEGRLRPRHAYAFGHVDKWANLASALPLIANFFTQTPVLRDISKFIAGVAPERSVPKFAPQTFKQWFAERQAKRNGHANGNDDHATGKQVILWADTFNNHFHPTTAQAAVEVLEAAGFQVKVPRESLCCGRPLYDYGFLDEAKRYLQRTMETLRTQVRAGVSVVVLEPSCAAVFRDELTNLYPNDEDAKRLNEQTFLLSEFLEKKAPDFKLPQLKRKAVVHGHCHHKSLMTMTDENSVLKKMGVDFEEPETGCCGMAGAFGFERGEHYDVSIACGERVLLPKVRETPKDALLVANGFSCREQIAQTTDRQVLHLAQVIQMALKEGERGAAGDYPERNYLHTPTPVSEKIKTAAVISAGVIVLGCAARRILKTRSE